MPSHAPLVRLSVVAASIAIAVSACGSGDSATVSNPTENPATSPTGEPATVTSAPAATEAPATTPTTTTTTTTSATSAITTAPSTVAPSTAAPTTAAPTTAPVPVELPADLAAALAELGEAAAYRSTSTTAQTLRIPVLDIDSTQVMDTDRPTVVNEVAADGDVHAIVDLGPTLAAGASDQATIDALDGVGFELWTTDDLLVMDTTGYAPLLELDPGADLGLFAPGLASIDLARMSSIGRDEAVRLLTGTGGDPRRLATELPTAITGIEPVPGDGVVYRATSSFGAVTAALGGDVADLATNVAAGIAPTIGVPVGELAAFYESVYARSDAIVEITLAADGSFEAMRVTADLSSVWTLMFAAEGGLDIGLGEDERAEAADAFADAELIVETLTTVDVDDALEVTLPPGEYEDRTIQAVAFFDTALD